MILSGNFRVGSPTWRHVHILWIGSCLIQIPNPPSLHPYLKPLIKPTLTGRVAPPWNRKLYTLICRERERAMALSLRYRRVKEISRFLTPLLYTGRCLLLFVSAFSFVFFDFSSLHLNSLFSHALFFLQIN